jgi:putative ABC transport system ATP-binding protein
VVFADEPTGNLDSAAGADVLGLLRRCVDDLGQTVVMVTHDAVAAGYADRALFFADGRVVDDLRQPTVEQVLDRVRAPRGPRAAA